MLSNNNNKDIGTPWTPDRATVRTRLGEMTMHKVNAPIMARLLLLSVVMILLPALAVESTVPAARPEPQLNNKQLKYLVNHAKAPADHLQLAAYYRDKAQQLRNRSAAHTAEADGYAKRSVFEPKTGIPGGLLRHCREWAWRYAEDAKQAEALAAMHDKLSQGMQNAGETPPHP